MNALEQKRQVESALQAFGSRSLYDAGLNLLEVLGYRSDLALRVSGLSAFRDVLDQQGRLPDQPARVAEWQAFEFLRQITGEDLVSRPQD